VVGFEFLKNEKTAITSMVLVWLQIGEKLPQFSKRSIGRRINYEEDK
jgi:hypothetical protein